MLCIPITLFRIRTHARTHAHLTLTRILVEQHAQQ